MGDELSAWLQRLKRYRRGRAAVQAWRSFGREVRSDGGLLKSLAEYPDAVLVAGCQRSGTTMLARLITGSSGMVNYYFGIDDEHDAALLLAGKVKKPQAGRYCFQTTYLNERYVEYLNTDATFRLIWVVRNPYAVVCSLLYNWERFALNELFEACGVACLDEPVMRRYKRFGVHGVSRLERACYAYAGKTAQALELAASLPSTRFCVVDYDRIVQSKDDSLSGIYRFIGLPYDREYAEHIHSQSLDKSERLSAHQRQLIEQLCMPVYERVCAMNDQ